MDCFVSVVVEAFLVVGIDGRDRDRGAAAVSLYEDLINLNGGDLPLVHILSERRLSYGKLCQNQGVTWLVFDCDGD